MKSEQINQIPKHAEEQIATLSQHLEKAGHLSKQVILLDLLEEVREFQKKHPFCVHFLSSLSLKEQWVVKVVIAIGQGHIFESKKSPSHPPLTHLFSSWKETVQQLVAIENLYEPVGGILGYQKLASSLFSSQKEKIHSLYPPEKIDLAKNTYAVRRAIFEGIRAQRELAELYPVGGAADRLDLVDEKTQEKLPAARLVFLGNHLLEGMIRDLQAREFLFFCLFGKQITTPIGMMTSKINGNTTHIQEILEENHWFGRPKETFSFFEQPLVPTFTKTGKWCLEKPGKLLLKPSGHGVIWLLAKKKKIFEQWLSLGKRKILVRQINNPMAGVDGGLLGFLGIGFSKDKPFGFASCKRKPFTNEGINVVKVEEKDNGETQAVLTNIEYCDFSQFHLKEGAQERLSSFPSNTNILFADIQKVIEATNICPFPGLVVNFREMSYFDGTENRIEKVARLEATMQNIADTFATPLSSKTSPEKEVSSYLTFYPRRKTLSTAKKKPTSNGCLVETPNGCYYDFLQNAYELLQTHCSIEVPPIVDQEQFKALGPPFLFSYHPALGPLYSIIGQKLHKGQLQIGSELQLEIADLEATNLQLNGSLLIVAECPLGNFDPEGKLHYSHKTGQCILENVSVENRGIDWTDEDHLFWKHQVYRLESLHIRLRGWSQFVARNVTFLGNYTIDVPDQTRIIATQEGNQVRFHQEPLNHPSSFWKYRVDENYEIRLSRTS